MRALKLLRKLLNHRGKPFLLLTSMLYQPGENQHCVIHLQAYLMMLQSEMPLSFLCGNLGISFSLNLSQSLNPGNWTEKIGLQIQGFPRQPYGIDCGIFMLMNGFYTTLDAPYDFSITDMPLLRQWWCIILMENFDLGSHGKLFAHWTDASKALLRGEVPPVFRLMKRKVDDITEDEEQQANEHLFSARVDLPDILCMGEDNQAEAALQYGRVWTEQPDDDEKDSILEPFKFTFYSTKDMWTFCEEIMDKRNSLAYCECHHR
ncbi:uncharacterized protein LOC133453133 [Cololabis saira]|uniref:uncharacterized protein LOC133453133 n=1 Tax=Cololabis saira TaxID=129043 RepID=UPI002AD2CD4D|nr:uncharacterized protein LOC133453133 [Cololabis saira]